MNNDLISRSELKKAVNNFYDNHFNGLVSNELITYAKAVDNAINNAPTVDVKGEKIIRCIDCKYYHPFKHWCDVHEDWAGGEDGFCSLAKMKGGDNNECVE